MLRQFHVVASLLNKFTHYRHSSPLCVCVPLTTCQNHFAGVEDQQNDLRLDNSVDETGKELGFVAEREHHDALARSLSIDLPAVRGVLELERFESYFEIHICTANHVLNLEVQKLRLKEARVQRQAPRRERLLTGKPSFWMTRA